MLSGWRLHPEEVPMSGLDYGPLHSRIKGRVSIERSLRALVLRCHRLGNGRQLSPANQRWLARLIDKLGEALDSQTPTQGDDPCHPR